MSYSEQVKFELFEEPIKSLCCQKAFLSGLLLGAQVMQTTVCVKVPELFAQRAAGEIKRHFGRDCTCAPYVQGKQSGVEIRFDSPKCAAMINSWDSVEHAALSDTFKCTECMGAFLRGAFCAKGTVSDPATGSHLELKCTTLPRARGLQALFAKE